MTSFTIDNWFSDIKGAFISILEESDTPMTHIDIAQKINLNKHDKKYCFAASVLEELVEDGEVDKEVKGRKTTYKIAGKVFEEKPKPLEKQSCKELRERLKAAGKNVGGIHEDLVRRVKALELEEQKKETVEN